MAFRIFRIAVLLLILLAIAALAYARLFGLPDAFNKRLVDEIAKKGVSVRFGKIYFDPFQGFVATDTVLFNPNDPELKLVTVNEIGLKLNYLRLFHRQQALDELRIEDATLTVPLDLKQPQESMVTGNGVSASLRVVEGGIISVDSFSGIFNGVRVGLSGTVHAEGKLPERLPQQAAQLNLLARIFKEFEKIHFSEPPELFVQFHVDLPKPELSTARALLKAGELIRETLKIDSVQTRIVLEKQVAHLQQLDLALYGGEIHLTGDYEISTDTAALEIRSTTNLKQLAVALGPPFEPFFHDYEFTANPIVTARVEGQTRELNLLVMNGTMEARKFTLRGIPVQTFRSKFNLRDGIFKMPNFVAVRPEGTFLGTYTCRLKDENFTLDAVSNLHPAPCRNIFPNHTAEFLHRFQFESPPQITFLWSGNWHDTEASIIKGHVRSGRFTIDDVPMKALDADAELTGHELSVTNMVLTREEGEVTGHVAYDGLAQTLEGNIVSTANPYDLARTLGTNALAAIAPYQFIQPPKVILTGIIHFQDESRTRLFGHVEGKNLYYWRMHGDSVSTEISIRQGYVGLSNFVAGTYSGQLAGAGEFFVSPEGTRYKINGRIDKIDLQQFTESITRTKPKSRGVVSGWASINGVASDTRSLEGAGAVSIEKAVLWEHPVFGELLTTILNVMLPGRVATSTATDARGDFTIEKGVANFSTLNVDAGITSIGATGRYKIWSGGLDFEVEGKPWNDVEWTKIFTWITMPFTKLFTMHLGGSWEQPEWRTVYLPKELLSPFKASLPKERTDEVKPSVPESNVSDKPR
ncbi:MAG: hypothetical protein EXS18_05445 [Verrucomicrobiae bacterium]|nr:hypothetical protein [Verrucomicrobiae bacterium]